MTVRILHVFDHSLPLQSGYSFRSRAIIEHQRRIGWKTIHLTSDKQGLVSAGRELVDGLEFHRTPPIKTLAGRLPGCGAWDTVAAISAALAPIVEAEKPDLIHAHSPCLTGLGVLRLPASTRPPLVYECRAFWEDAAVDHGTTHEGSLRYRLTRALESFVFRRADWVTTICEGLRRDIIARGIAADRVTTIPNGVDISAFSPPDADTRNRVREALGIEDRYVVGFIGSFYAYEGLELLLEAADRVAGDVPKLSLLFVGGGPEADRLRARASGIRSPVHFTGRVPHEEVRAYYAAMDLLAYPRHAMRLTELVTPLKPLEAMAFRRPVIASEIGGHRELLEDGNTALLFSPDDADALAAAVIRAHENPQETARRVARARTFVERQRTWESSVARYKPVYERLLDCAARRAMEC